MVARPDSRQVAMQLEEQGFDGVSFVDSQNLSGDVYVAMTSAVLATEPVSYTHLTLPTILLV